MKWNQIVFAFISSTSIQGYDVYFMCKPEAAYR